MFIICNQEEQFYHFRNWSLSHSSILHSVNVLGVSSTSLFAYFELSHWLTGFSFSFWLFHHAVEKFKHMLTNNWQSIICISSLKKNNFSHWKLNNKEMLQPRIFPLCLLRRLVATATEEERNIEIIDSSASYLGFYESFMSEAKWKKMFFFLS